MTKTFIESRIFTDKVQGLLGDEAYFLLQTQLMEQPDQGVVMPGCGGLRKLRVGDPRRHRGKRGGFRVIYLHVPEADWILMLDIYRKGEKDYLTAVEKKILARLADEFRREALRAVSKQKQGNRR